MSRTTTDLSQLPELCDQDDRPSTLTFSSYSETEGDTIQGTWRLYATDRARVAEASALLAGFVDSLPEEDR